MKIEIKERKRSDGRQKEPCIWNTTRVATVREKTCTSISCPIMPLVLQSTIGLHTTRLWRYEQSASSPLLYWRKENAKSEEQGNGLTWLQWCDDYIKWSVDCGNCKKMIGHKNVVRKRIATYLRRVDKKDILLKDVSKDEICGLF